jgi:hypothetical protein
MLKKLLIAVTVFAVLLMLALSWITARYVDQEEILRAKTEMDRLRATRDSIYAFVAVKDSMQEELQVLVKSLNANVNRLRVERDSLERARIDKQFGVRQIRGKEALLDTLRGTFPEVRNTLRLSEVYDKENDVFLEYLMTPLWFYETFVIDHKNSENYKQQRNKLLVVDSLQTHISTLKDSVFHLEQEKSRAYKNGYDEAYAKYDTLNHKYIDLLQKPPQVNIGLPTWGTILGSAAVGVVIGTQLEGRK